ncbi:MAG: hypothetical protein ABI402_12580 [Ferruginibacter sp.]
MKIEQIYSKGSNHTTYYLESNGEAAIFDPSDEIHLIIEKANVDYARIKYVFETGFHENLERLHMAIKNETGGDIIFGCGDINNYYGITANDNQVFRVGDCKVKAIYTPGHTLEATSYLIIDENGMEHGLITGATLLIGDVGEPNADYKNAKALSKESLVRILYKTIKERILPLKDILVIYSNPKNPGAHRKMMSAFITDTLGHQKKVNYALQPMSENDFVNVVLGIAV